jgi:hypothetical protein
MNTTNHPESVLRRSIARLSDRFFLSMSPHRSPTAETRWAIVRNVNVLGPTSPRSNSCQVHGAETGAFGLARTV